MARAPMNDGLNKSQRYRQRRAMQGMKLLRLWVPDPAAPGFAEELRRLDPDVLYGRVITEGWELLGPPTTTES